MEKGWIFYALITILLWSTTPAVVKLTLLTINFSTFFFWTTLFSLLGLTLIISIQGKLKFLRAYSIKEHLWLILLGALSMFFYSLFYFFAINSGSAAQVNILNYTWPIWLIAFSTIFLKEKMTVKKALSVLIGFIGVMIVIIGFDIKTFASMNIVSIIFALLGAISWALFSTLSKKKKFEAFSSMFYYSLYGLVMVIVYVSLKSDLVFPDFKGLIGTFYVGALTTGLGYALWIKTLTKANISLVSNLVFLTPFLSLIWIWLFIHENIYFSQIFGLVLIISSIMFQKGVKK